MADLTKAYSRINWQNSPSTSTALNETNLNKMDAALNEVDNRVISLNTNKLDAATAQGMVKDVTFEEETGIFTVTYLNGVTATIDTKLEKIAVNFAYDSENERLVITLDDGTVQYVDLATLISQYEFTNSDTIAFSVDESGKVSAIIPDGAITEDKLQTNFLADIKVESAKAESAANDAILQANRAETEADRAESIADYCTPSEFDYEPTSGVLEIKNISTSEQKALIDLDKTKNYLEYLWKKLEGIVYTTTTVDDDEDATVPSNAMEYATLETLGGISRKGRNLTPYPYNDEASKEQVGITFTVNADGSVNVVGTSTGYAQFLITELVDNWLVKGKTYTLCNNSNTNAKFLVMERLADGSDVWHISDNNKVVTFTVNENTEKIQIKLQVNPDTTVDTTVYPMLCEGTEALPFEPYTTELIDAKVNKIISKDKTTLIPQGILSLADYGIGISDTCYNYVDFAHKKYHHKVGSVVLNGTENWTTRTISDGAIQLFRLSSAITSSDQYTALVNGFDSVKTETEALNHTSCFISRWSNKIDFRDDAIASLDAWKSYLSSNPITVYYELAEEEVIDVSNILLDEYINLLEVEGNGSIKFEYPQKSKYSCKTPNRVEFKEEIVR